MSQIHFGGKKLVEQAVKTLVGASGLSFAGFIAAHGGVAATITFVMGLPLFGPIVAVMGVGAVVAFLYEILTSE